jgi:hypothetical protein
MMSDNECQAVAKARGWRVKNNNLMAALLSGFILAGLSTFFFRSAISARGLLFGLAVGLLYANGFEYCLHRFLLHSGRGIFAQHHMVHHNTLHAPEAALFINFSRNPSGVVALFIANAIPFLLQWIFHAGWVAGMFAGFALYYMAFEEIHWRTHMGGWMPKWLKPAAKHHLLHHARGTERFNIFLPIFDWAFSFGPGARTSSLTEEKHHQENRASLLSASSETGPSAKAPINS